MGGAKKKTLSQMEKTQTQEKRPEGPKKGKAGKGAPEKQVRGIELPDVHNEQFVSQVSKMPAITPYSLASEFNLRLSVAKDVLEELMRKEIIRQVGGNSRLRVYAPVKA